MKATEFNQDSLTKNIAYLLVLAVFISFTFISSDSFWIDEGNTAFKASRPTLVNWWKAMHAVTGSDSQMPGFMLYAWIWEKLVPNTEFYLRASNIPWLAILICSLRRFKFAWLLIVTSPFILSYLSEFRPYMMTMAGTGLALSGLSKISKIHASTVKGYPLVLLGCLIMSSSSLIGVVWSIGCFVYLILVEPRNTKIYLKKPSTYYYGILFAGLAYYYVWTLTQGQKAASMGGGIITSVGASIYELIGLYGLGPGKTQLRSDPGTVKDYLFTLAPMITIYGMLFLMGIYSFCKYHIKIQVIKIFLSLLIPIVILLTLIFIKDFRLLGRHLAPLAVLFIVLISNQFSDAITNQTTGGLVRTCRTIFHILVTIFILLSLWSALQLRLNDRHRKDDYRSAVAIAKQAIANKRKIIWAADPWTGYFYGLDQEQQNWQPWHNSALPDLSSHPLIIMSKPDIYDPHDRLIKQLSDNHYTPVKYLKSFTIYDIN